jgi:hypothetical protein
MVTIKQRLEYARKSVELAEKNYNKFKSGANAAKEKYESAKTRYHDLSSKTPEWLLTKSKPAPVKSKAEKEKEKKEKDEFWDCSFKPDNWVIGKKSIPSFDKASEPFEPKSKPKKKK